MKAKKCKADRVLLAERPFKEVLAALIKSEVYFIAGAVTLYVPSTRTKYLLQKACKLWPTETGEIIYMPPGEAARTELKKAFPDIKRIGWAKKHIVLFDKRPPLMYSGEKRGEMTYVDLKGAYHQIYGRLWLDAPYPRGLMGRYPLRGVANELETWKAARNSVIGISRNRHVTAMRGKKRIQLSVKNLYLSPFLWGTVQEILHWIAGEAITRGAIYVNTDGYIFNSTANSDSFFQFLLDNNLVATIRTMGEGHIAGWNKYRIGDKQTAGYKNPDLFSTTKEFSNVGPNGLWAAFWGRVYRIDRHGQV